MCKQIISIEDYNSVTKNDLACIFYFSTKSCNVCRVLKPKIFNMIKDKYPKLQTYSINIEDTFELSRKLSIFTAPTFLIYFEGREFFRGSRNTGIEQLSKQISRPYDILFY